MTWWPTSLAGVPKVRVYPRHMQIDHPKLDSATHLDDAVVSVRAFADEVFADL